MKPPVPILLSDTVGFIRKLPTLLVESFKSTLAEALEADVLIHVVDISNPRFEAQMQSVKETLHEIGASEKPEIVVFNKIDAYKSEDSFFVGESEMTLDQFEKSWIAKENAPAVFISAQEKNNISKLRQILLSELFKSRGKKID
jgi:GTP-binding protein HflX